MSGRLKSSDELNAKPYKVNPAIAVLDDLQAQMDQSLSEIRRIHAAMLTIRDVCGVEYEIRLPSVVG